MKNLSKQFIYSITLLLAIGFTSCENSNEELSTELTIQQKVALLEGGEWLLKGFEDSLMFTFVSGERLLSAGTDSVFNEPPVSLGQTYSISGDLLMIDFIIGPILKFDLKFSCDNTIVEFYSEGELHSTLYKRGSNYKDCL